MMTPKISVIVPVYNVEKYLHRCIDSILSQTFKDFELLLIDDGSPDNCGKICDEYAQQDNRVRVFHKPNGGVSSARNLGLDNARGEWIAFVDSDDYVEVDYLDELVSYSRRYDVDYVLTLNTIKEYTNDSCLILQPSNYSDLFSLYRILKYGSPWAKLFKNELIKSLNLRFNTNIHMGEDAMFGLHYLMGTKNIAIIQSNRYIYDQSRPDSLTKITNSYDSELLAKLELDRIVQLLNEKYTLNTVAQHELEKLQVWYLERTLNSIMKESKRSLRIGWLRNIDFSLYYIYKKPYSWKEWILFVLLRMRCFYLYDFLMRSK